MAVDLNVPFHYFLHHLPQFPRQRGQVRWPAEHDLLQDFAQFLQFSGGIRRACQPLCFFRSTAPLRDVSALQIGTPRNELLGGHAFFIVGKIEKTIQEAAN